MIFKYISLNKTNHGSMKIFFNNKKQYKNNKNF